MNVLLTKSEWSRASRGGHSRSRCTRGTGRGAFKAGLQEAVISAPQVHRGAVLIVFAVRLVVSHECVNPFSTMIPIYTKGCVGGIPYLLKKIAEACCSVELDMRTDRLARPLDRMQVNTYNE